MPQKGVKKDVTFKQLITSKFSDDNWEGPFSKLAITDADKMLKEINTKSDGSNMTATKLDNDNMTITINNISPEMIRMTQTDENFKMGNIVGSDLVLDNNDIYSLYHMHKEIDALDKGKYNNIILNIHKMWETISPVPAAVVKKKKKSYALNQEDMAAVEESLSKFALSKEELKELGDLLFGAKLN